MDTGSLIYPDLPHQTQSFMSYPGDIITLKEYKDMSMFVSGKIWVLKSMHDAYVYLSCNTYYCSINQGKQLPSFGCFDQADIAT